jgi:hypothetical protein
MPEVSSRRGRAHPDFRTSDDRVSKLPDWHRDGLTASGTDLDIAESWCDAWEHAAAIGGIARDRDYWGWGRRWIDAQRRAGKTPFN